MQMLEELRFMLVKQNLPIRGNLFGLRFNCKLLLKKS